MEASEGFPMANEPPGALVLFGFPHHPLELRIGFDVLDILFVENFVGPWRRGLVSA
jgi:hypothetical protein